MILYIDTESRKLVQNLTSDRIAASPAFMQGDNEPLEIHLLLRGASTLYEDKILNPAHDFLRVGIARFKGEPKLLTIGSFYTPLENGGCVLTLPLNTLEIESALGNNASLDAFLEIEYSTSEGRITTVLQTACKVKNDLIEDAPNVQIPEQFFTAQQTEALFLKNSDNLESLEDKTIARENLSVFSRDEVYSKSDIDEQNEAFLEKSDNLASLENKDIARANINAAPFEIYKDINMLGSFSGVYSRNSFDYSNQNYGKGLGGSSYETVDVFTILTTYLATSANVYILGNSSSYDTDIEIRSNGNVLYYGYSYDENGYSVNNEITLSKPIEYGDKLAITFKDRILRVYKNAELVGERESSSNIKFYRPTYILNYTGLKKHFAYSDNFALPHTKAEGVSMGYSIEEWANNVAIPYTLIKGLMYFGKTNYSTALGSGSWLKCAAPKTWEGVYNTMVVYKEKNTYGRDFILFSASTAGYVTSQGLYLFKMRVYIPSSNTNGKKIYVRCGTSAITSSYLEVISRKNIDASGYITELDAWVDVELKFRWKQQSFSFGSMQIHLVNEANSFQFIGTNEDTDERFYIASSSIQGLEGLTAYYEGGLQANAWLDLTGNGHDIVLSSTLNVVSYPPDNVNSTSKTLSVENFSYSVYFDAFIPRGYEIVQIVFTPNENVPDTSGEASEYDRNILRISGGHGYIVEELLPAMNAKTPYILQLKRGLGESTYTVNIDSMYNLNFGGSLSFYFQKSNS